MSWLWKVVRGACSSAVGYRRGRRDANKKTLARTGRAWCIDATSRRVVGRRRTFVPWRGVKLTLSTGVLADESDERAEHVHILEEEEVVVRCGRLDRRIVLSRQAPYAAEKENADTASTRVLFAVVECPPEVGVPSVEVTRLFNERCASMDGSFGMTELVAVMAARSPDQQLSVLAADARSRLFLVMHDLREFSFCHGQAVSVAGN
jgi:hypothetical protein